MKVGDVLPTETCPRCGQPARFLRYATLHNGTRWVSVRACLVCIGPAEDVSGLSRYREATLNKMLELPRRGRTR